MGRKVRKFACFTNEQQECFDKLPKRQQDYITYRGQGYSKSQAYKMVGYEGKNSSQAAYLLENRCPGMKELIDTLLSNKKAKEIEVADSALNRQIDALAQQQDNSGMLQIIENADGETARRIQFYRDIANGKIEEVKETKIYGANGNLVKRTVVKVKNIASRIQARKELDRILGLNQIIDVDKLQCGDITINIVDASKREELEDSRNKVDLDPDDVEIIDGEQVIVREDDGVKSNSDNFFDIQGEDDD